MIRMTYALAQVLQAVDRGYCYGFDIAEAARLRGGTVYPILRRLERAGLVTARWERHADVLDEGRPPRRYYRLRSAAAPLLEHARDRFPFRSAVAAPRMQVTP